MKQRQNPHAQIGRTAEPVQLRDPPSIVQLPGKVVKQKPRTVQLPPIDPKTRFLLDLAKAEKKLMIEKTQLAIYNDPTLKVKTERTPIEDFLNTTVATYDGEPETFRTINYPKANSKAFIRAERRKTMFFELI